MSLQDYPNDLVTLTTAANEFEAGAIVAVLEEAGIDAVAFGGSQMMGITDLPGLRVQVQVRRADLERAEAALKQNVADSIDLDWNEVDLGAVEDDVPIAHPHADRQRPHMPVIVRLGFLLAAAIVIVMLIAGLWLLLLR
jgi:Putative prokaryotic signal transducing protein